MSQTGKHADLKFDKKWYIVDDRVMGGKSQSEIKYEDGYAKFFGKTNTDGGGFCSARTQNFEKMDLSKFKGIRFKARSRDKAIYKFGLHDTYSFDSI